MEREEKIQVLREWIRESENIVFFGGAGTSTESGIPDFRSQDGLYSLCYSDPPEEILSRGYFLERTEDFYRFYRDKLVWEDARPNPAHLALAKLERLGKLKAIITQNVDGLHQKGGSRKVLELHGSIHRNTCMECGRGYPLAAVMGAEGIPRCSCGGVIKPDVVLYGEGLDAETTVQAMALIKGADILIVAGTSLTVYPAAGYLSYFQGRHLILINRSETPWDERADLRFHDSIGSVLEETMQVFS